MNEHAGTEQRRLARRPDVLWRSAPGFLVLATVAGTTLVAVGGAAAVWDHLSRPLMLDELCAELAGDHDVDIEQMRADVGPFVDRLIDEGYVDRIGHDR